MKKFLLGASLLSVLALAGCDQSETVASTTAGQIDSQELYEEMKGRYGTQTLQTMLLQDILEDRYGDQVSEEDVDALLQENIDTVGGEEQFEMYLAAQGISMDSMKESARLSLLIAEAVKENEGADDETIQQYYEEWQPEVTTSHILVDDEETANDIISQLNEGANFEDLVQEHSTDTGTVQSGGQVSFTPGQDEVVKEYEDAAMALNEGETSSEPVESAYGYHIIRMDEKPEKGSFEEEKEAVTQQYVESLMADSTKITEALKMVAEEANIIIEDQELSGALEGLLGGEGQGSDSSSEEDSSEGEGDSSEEETTSEETDDAAEESSEAEETTEAPEESE